MNKSVTIKYDLDSRMCPHCGSEDIALGTEEVPCILLTKNLQLFIDGAFCWTCGHWWSDIKWVKDSLLNVRTLGEKMNEA